MFLYIQLGSDEMKQERPATDNNLRKEQDKRSSGVFVRLSGHEKAKLKELSRRSGISVSQLLRSGALDGLDQLPRFRTLPPDVIASLSTLNRLTTAMAYLSSHAEQDAVYAHDIQLIVYEVGEVIRQVSQSCADNMASHGSVKQLEELLGQLQQPAVYDSTVSEILSRLQSLRDSFQTSPFQ